MNAFTVDTAGLHIFSCIKIYNGVIFLIAINFLMRQFYSLENSFSQYVEISRLTSGE